MTPPPSQSALISCEELPLLLFPPLEPVGSPADRGHQQHQPPRAQQPHGHHFGPEQRVEGERHAGARHADHQGNDAEREHAAVPGLLRAPRGLGQSLQSQVGLQGVELPSSQAAPPLPAAVQTLVLGEGAGLTAVATVQVWVKDGGGGLTAGGAAHPGAPGTDALGALGGGPSVRSLEFPPAGACSQKDGEEGSEGGERRRTFRQRREKQTLTLHVCVRRRLVLGAACTTGVCGDAARRLYGCGGEGEGLEGASHERTVSDWFPAQIGSWRSGGLLLISSIQRLLTVTGCHGVAPPSGSAAEAEPCVLLLHHERSRRCKEGQTTVDLGQVRVQDPLV